MGSRPPGARFGNGSQLRSRRQAELAFRRRGGAWGHKAPCSRGQQGAGLGDFRGPPGPRRTRNTHARTHPACTPAASHLGGRWRPRARAAHRCPAPRRSAGPGADLPGEPPDGGAEHVRPYFRDFCLLDNRMFSALALTVFRNSYLASISPLFEPFPFCNLIKLTKRSLF